MSKQIFKKNNQPENEATIVSQSGYIWLLGQHRIMCGDSTNINLVNQLMGKDKADMGFIDPPYNVAYAGRRILRDKLKNDNLTKAEYTQFLDQLMAANKASLKRGASFYIFFGSGYMQELQAILAKNQFEIRNHIIWAKNHFVISYARYKSKHEFILYCHQKDERDPWYGDKKTNHFVGNSKTY